MIALVVLWSPSASALTLDEAWAAAGTNDLQLALAKEAAVQQGTLRGKAWSALQPRLTANASYVINNTEIALSFAEGIEPPLLDLFPPSPRDPLGMHKLIWDEISDVPFAFPAGKDRILASYETGAEKVAYVEPIAVGDRLPDMPLFVAEGLHVKVPLETTYGWSWDACPEALQEAVLTGVLPNPDADDD